MKVVGKLKVLGGTYYRPVETEVDAYLIIDYLAITASAYLNQSKLHYVVTHIPSGFALMQGHFSKYADAKCILDRYIAAAPQEVWALDNPLTNQEYKEALTVVYREANKLATK